MRKLFAALGMLFLLGLPSVSFALSSVTADSSGLLSTGTEAFGDNWVGGGGGNENTSLGSFVGSKIILPVFGLTGLAFFCLALYAGILWMTAMGDPKKVTKAQDILVNATIGLIIIVASYALTNAVLSGVTTGKLT